MRRPVSLQVFACGRSAAIERPHSDEIVLRGFEGDLPRRQPDCWTTLAWRAPTLPDCDVRPRRASPNRLVARKMRRSRLH